MNTASLIAFGMCFCVGPMIYALLVRAPAQGRTFVPLAIAVVASITGALVLRQISPVWSLGGLWLAWVLVLSLFVLGLQRRLRSRSAWRVTFVMGLLATTMPWYGLATARMVAS